MLELAEDLKDLAEKLPSISSMSRMKKGELIALANENGLAVDGTRADLISRMQEAKTVIENGE